MSVARRARWSWLAALALAGGRAGAAEACTLDPCAGYDAFAGVDPVQDDGVPTDGVVLIQASWFGELEAEALLAGISVTVTLEDVEVAGTLAATELAGVLLWRPDAPLTPLATYVVTARFVNPEGVPAVCAAGEVVSSFEFLAAEGPAAPLERPRISPRVEVEEAAITAIDALACCDGAMPRTEAVCGIAEGLTWSAGQCASTRGRTRLRVELRAANGVDRPTRGQLLTVLYEDGEVVRTTLGTGFTRWLVDAGACYVIEQRSLATGEALASDPMCFTVDEVGPLGEAALDPRAQLAAPCAGALYVCEAVDGAWDPERCAPWVAPDDGCGCRGADGPAGLLVGGLLLRRRRRQSRSMPTTAVLHAPRLDQ